MRLPASHLWSVATGTKWNALSSKTARVQIRVRPKTRLAATAEATATPPVQGETTTGPDGPALTKALQDWLAVDLSVPASPAMAVLGVAGTEIQRPAFPRELAASLVKGFDKDGKNRDAFAIDVVPASLWFRSSITGGDPYKGSHWMQWLARTTLSLGASKVEDTTAGSQYGAGVRIGLIDGSDPGHFWQLKESCLRPVIENTPITKGRLSDGSRTVTDSWVGEIEKNCKLAKLVPDLWAQPALYVGYAQGWHSDTKSVRDASGNAKAFWATYSIGLNPRSKTDLALGQGTDRVRALLQLYLARKIDESIANPNGNGDFVREDRSEFVARLRFGKVKWHGYVEAGAARTRTAGLDSEAIRRVGFGVEYMLRDDLWLVVGSMRETGFRDGTRSLINTGLRFSQVPKGLFGLPDLVGK